MTIGLFRELLLISIGKRDSFSKVPSSGDWQALFAMSRKQALLGICFGGIQTLVKSHPEQLSNLPVNLKMQWIGIAAMVQDHNCLMNRRCVELQRAMISDGFKTCILKGQGVASFYGSLALHRQSGDIDIYVDAERATILRYLADKGIPNDGWDYVHAHPRFFKDVEVELHYRLSVFRNLFLNGRFQRFIEENKEELFSNKVKLADVGDVNVPTSWMNLFYLLHHIYRHMFSEGIGLRQLMDYYFALNSISLPSDDYEKLLEAVRRFGMEHFAHGLMWVLSDVFSLEEKLMPWIPDEKEGRFILEDIMQSGNFGKLDDRYGKPTSNKICKFITTLRRSFSLLTHYHSEALWTPVYYVWHFCWKKSMLIRGFHNFFKPTL